MLSTTRFPNGVTNVGEDSLFAAMGQLAPTKFHTYMEDFDYYAAADWTVTETQAGATQALTNGDGGLLLLTNSAADDDLNALQKVGASFAFAAGKKLWFEARFKVSDATQSDFVMGLQGTDTTPLDTSDGVFFLKADGSTSVSLVVEASSTATTTSSVATVANDTFVRLGFWYDGDAAVYYFVNGALGGKSVTTNLPTADLRVSFGIQNG